VDYVVSDVEGDSVRLRVEYSINGVDWNRASIVGDTLVGRSRYSGYLVWRSGVDLPGYYGDVIFRVTPRDNDPHNWGESDTIVFRLDNNYPPVVKIDSVFGVKRVTGAYRDTLRFYFTVTDVEGDTVFVSFYYRSADTLGSEWRRVVTFSGDSGLLVPGSGYEVSWVTSVDLGGLVGNYYFKIECSDVDIGVSDSVLIQIDNLGVPRVGILNTFAGEYRDSVRFDYRVLDEEGDPVVLVFEYSLDGERWIRATVVGDSLLSDSTRYEGSVIWLTREDLPGVDDTVMFRIVPFDANRGVLSSVMFHLDNNEVPVITYIGTPQVEKSGAFEIKFVAFDQERDSLSFKFEYSVGDTMSWKGATVRMGSRYNDTLGVIWLSDSDLPNQDVWVYFKITPFDRDTGKYAISGRFKVDNRTGPIVFSVSPGPNALNVLRGANIEVKFAYDIDSTSLTGATVKVLGSKTGFYATNMVYYSDTRTLLIDPVKDFKPGEVVSVTLTRGIRFADGDTVPGSYIWSFTVKVDDGSGSFVRVKDVGVGSYPRSVHTSDLDGDGDVDIVVANSNSNTVSIIRNDGGLSFVRVSDISVGSYPISVHTSDLDGDGDGDVDIVVANSSSNTVSIVRNDGGLSFVRVSDISVGSNPWSVHPSDLDGDGDIDIVVAK